MKKLLSLTITVAICAIGFAQNTVNIHKVSAHLAELSNQYNARQETKGTHAVPRNVNALVTLTTSCYADAFFDEHGCRLIDSVGRIYIVSIPLNKVAALSYNDTIERIEAERMPRPAMEVTPQQVNASAVYAGNGLPQAYTGAGVVAGVIALWLQAKPDLTPAQALDVIRRTSTHPDGTMEYPNNTYGHGQIDAYRGLLEVLNLPVSIPNLSQHQPQNVIFRLENRRLYADFGEALHPKHVTFNIYRLNGQLVMTQSGRDYIDLSRLKGEVYAVQLITDSKATTGSTLIRLP